MAVITDRNRKRFIPKVIHFPFPEAQVATHSNLSSQFIIPRDYQTVPRHSKL